MTFGQEGMPINICMDKEDVEYTYNGMLFSLEKKEILPRATTSDEPRGRYAKKKYSRIPSV